MTRNKGGKAKGSNAKKDGKAKKDNKLKDAGVQGDIHSAFAKVVAIAKIATAAQ